MKKAGDDGNQNMGADMGFDNEELDFWYRFDKETESFTLLLISSSDQNMMKLHFSEGLFGRFLQDSMAFFISTREEDLDEDESKADEDESKAA